MKDIDYNKKKLIILSVVSFFIIVSFLIMAFSLYSNSQALSKNPLVYCADYIGEDTLCTCTTSRGEYYLFTNEKALHSTVPFLIGG